MVVALRAERDRAAGVEVGRDEEQPVRQLAEVVGAARRGEQSREEGVDGAIVENARRHCARQRRERLHHPAMQWVAQVLGSRPQTEPGQRQQAATEFVQCGLEEDLGLERGIATVLDEQPVHLGRRDAVRQRGGDEAPRRYADVDIQRVEVDALERVGQRQQRPDFVDAAQGTAAREREPDRARRSIAHAPPARLSAGRVPKARLPKTHAALAA